MGKIPDTEHPTAGSSLIKDRLSTVPSSQQCSFENIFSISSTCLLTQSRSLGSCRFLLFAGAQPSLTDGTATTAHSRAHHTHTLCFLQCLFKNYIPSHLFSSLLGEQNPQRLRVSSAAGGRTGKSSFSFSAVVMQICTLVGELKAKQQSAMPCQPYPAQTTTKVSSNWVYLFSPPRQSNVQSR